MASKTFYTPVFSGPIEGYAVNFLKRNMWRVARFMDHADMMQEAQLVFLKLAKRYPEMDTPQHFMALFKSSWSNHFTDLSHIDTKIKAEMQLEDEDGTSFVSSLPGDLCHDGMLLTAIRQAPSEIQSVLYLFANAPVELLDLASAAWKSNGHNRDHGNSMICRMLGFQKGTDIIGMVETYFSAYN